MNRSNKNAASWDELAACVASEKLNFSAALPDWQEVPPDWQEVPPDWQEVPPDWRAALRDWLGQGRGSPDLRARGQEWPEV